MWWSHPWQADEGRLWRKAYLGASVRRLPRGEARRLPTGPAHGGQQRVRRAAAALASRAAVAPGRERPGRRGHGQREAVRRRRVRGRRLVSV